VALIPSVCILAAAAAAVVIAKLPNRAAASGVTTSPILTEGIVSLLIVFCLHKVWQGNALTLVLTYLSVCCLDACVPHSMMQSCMPQGSLVGGVQSVP